MKGPLSLPQNVVLKAPLASCRVSGDNSWARSSDLSGPLEICSSATETKAVVISWALFWGPQGGKLGRRPTERFSFNAPPDTGDV